MASSATSLLAQERLDDGVHEGVVREGAGTPALLASPLPIRPAVTPIQLDGVVSDEEWGHVQPLPMTMFSPDFRGEMTERTEIRITHDHEYLYVSGRMYDSSP